MRAKKSLGQNFLRDTDVIRRIVASLAVKPGDTVIEIGPGRGALTEFLVDSEASLLAIEIDRELIPGLKTRFGSNSNFEVIEADFLTVDIRNRLAEKPPAKIKIVGNLPYYISTPIIQKLITLRQDYDYAVLMLQREVADRLTAKPGNSDRGFFTVLTENAFAVERLFDVRPDAFFPVPKVWSSVIKLTPKASEIEDHEAFSRLLSSAFAQKRKTILNNLKSVNKNADEILDLTGIELTRRAETLTLNEWKGLHENLLKANKVNG
jgi:16S rRNA (adenine1518-N6/adenine1519-N6)-dimethyltransferase